VIDRVRPLYTEAMQFENLSIYLEQYATMQQTFVKLFQLAQTDILRRLTGSTQTAAVGRLQALEILALLQSAHKQGLDMNEIVQSDDETRRQWQRLIEDALAALRQVDTVRTDIDQLRGGMEQVKTLTKEVQQLKTQVQGSDELAGLLQQVRQVQQTLDDLLNIPGDSRAKLTADIADLRTKFGTLERDIRDNAANIARLTGEKIPRAEKVRS
jgi:uncharacterized coiled-coil DUF342 family protein